jgi:hypothetical protein
MPPRFRRTRSPNGVFAGMPKLMSAAGNANIVQVFEQKTTRSGRRPKNVYANGADFGTPNRLFFVGTPEAFTDSNHNIIPAPTAPFLRTRRPASRHPRPCGGCYGMG